MSLWVLKLFINSVSSKWLNALPLKEDFYLKDAFICVHFIIPYFNVVFVTPHFAVLNFLHLMFKCGELEMFSTLPIVYIY